MNLKTISNIKLFIPIVSLILILLSFSLILLYTNYSKIKNLNELSTQVKLSNTLSDTLHSLQKERGLSSGYVSSNYEHFQEQLQKQRQETNTYINKLQKQLPTIRSEELKTKIQKEVIEALQYIQNIRILIDKHHLNYKDIIDLYSKITNSIICIITEITKFSTIPSITQNILAYINFLYYKEYAGVERALGVVLLSKKDTHQEVVTEFISYIALQKQTKKMFFQFATPD
ncbi:MAG: hypothetical protein GXO11_06330, partial [Epsilonproteobacteria bacterium]|nr:hypothetical protein [Campylobacterota bacterium]